jgi:hypothetical protein
MLVALKELLIKWFMVIYPNQDQSLKIRYNSKITLNGKNLH